MSELDAWLKWVLAGTLALFLGAVGLHFLSHEAVKPPAIPTADPAPDVDPLTPPAATPITGSSPPDAPAGSPLAAELNAADRNPQHDVEVLHTMIVRYLRRMRQRQGPPIGDDIDLAHAFTGHNPMHLLVLRPDHPALSPDGHLRDRWGTPYFIHPLGNNAFEVRSAGPDRKLFTADDVIWEPNHADE